MNKYKRNYLPHKTYVAGITQTGTAAPVATVREDNTGSNLGASSPVLARTGAGVYTVTKTGLFPAGKTSAHITNNVLADGSKATVERTSANVLTIKTFDGSGAAADAVLGAGGVLMDLVIKLY